MMRLKTMVKRSLARKGYVLQAHPAARRQRLLTKHGVDLVVDVGAAKGLYGVELRDFGYEGRIVSFEPLREAFRLLEARSLHDDAWSAHNIALGESRSVAEINVASNSDSSSLLPMAAAHHDASPTIDYVAKELVQVHPLADVAAGFDLVGERPFVKLDVQGFERSVIAGSGSFFDQAVGLQMELSFVQLYDGGMLVDEALAWAYGHGFTLVDVLPGFASPEGGLLQADGVFFR